MEITIFHVLKTGNKDWSLLLLLIYLFLNRYGHGLFYFITSRTLKIASCSCSHVLAQECVIVQIRWDSRFVGWPLRLRLWFECHRFPYKRDRERRILGAPRRFSKLRKLLWHRVFFHGLETHPTLLSQDLLIPSFIGLRKPIQQSCSQHPSQMGDDGRRPKICDWKNRVLSHSLDVDGNILTLKPKNWKPENLFLFIITTNKWVGLTSI